MSEQERIHELTLRNKELENKLLSTEQKLTEALAKIDTLADAEGKMQTITQENEALKASVTELEAKLKAQEEANAISKEMIAEVMLEAQRKAQEMTESAKFEVQEARAMLAKTELELDMVMREARIYYRQVQETQKESDRLFGEMLSNLEQLTQDTELQH